MRRAALACLVIATAAAASCKGGGERPRAQAAAPALPPIEARPASPDDVIVAKVDGRPVYGSCVAAQVAALHEDRRRALDDCVDFELLAGVAAARGVAADAEVVDGYRTGLVNRFVDVEFRQRYRQADDLPPKLLAAAFDKFKWRMHRPAYRYAVYVRAPLDAKATPAEEQAAHALVQEIYAAVGDRNDLFPSDLFDAALRIANGRKLEAMHSPFGTAIDGPAAEQFAHPLFALPAIGTVTPPSRTPWGWDLILWVDALTPLESTREEVLAWLFPQLRQGLFDDWVGELVKERGVDVRVDEQRLASRVDPDEAAGVGAAAAAPGAPPP
jgi:hypothetical protein